MKKILRAFARAKRLFALSLFLLPGLTSSAQPWWPATAPSLSELPFAAGTFPTTAPEWVNCDMYNYYDSGTPYYLLAFTYDDVSGGTSTVHVRLYDSKTTQVLAIDIPEAKHPDIAIGDFLMCSLGTPGPNVNNTFMVAYESIINNRVEGLTYHLSDVGTGSMYATLALCGNMGGFAGSKNPHVDFLANGGTLINGYDVISSFVTAYEVNQGNGAEIRAYFFDNNWTPFSSPSGSNFNDVFVDYGIRPDVAYTKTATGQRAYFVYYKDDFTEIKRAEVDPDFTSFPFTFSVTPFPSMEVSATFYGYPRIESASIKGSSSTPWHALAECTGEGIAGIDIHGYNYDGSVNVIDYGMAKNEFSPTVTVANGDATPGNPTDVGNDGYTVGWNVFGSELNALYLDESNTNNVIDGYDQVNTTPLSTNYGTGKNLFAMTSSTNSGIGLAAAWWDGSDIQLKLAGNSFCI